MNQDSPDSTTAGIPARAQCARTLGALRLRERGEPIVTMWTTDHTAERKPHRVARYVLVPRGVA